MAYASADILGKIDGSSFSKIGFIEGRGNSNINTKYSFADSKPLGQIISYRLKQTDKNGNFVYSDEVQIKFIPGFGESASELSESIYS